MPKDDPVVERVRAARREIVAECGYDFRALYEWAKKIEAQHPERLRSYKRGQSGDQS